MRAIVFEVKLTADRTSPEIKAGCCHDAPNCSVTRLAGRKKSLNTNFTGNESEPFCRVIGST